MKNRLRAWMNRAAGWLFPRGARCLCCGDPRRASEEDCLCDSCREKLKDWRVPAGACNRCLSPVTRGKPCAFCGSAMMRPIEAVFAPYRFGGETRQLIHALKFDACEEAVPLLAQAMADALPRRDFDCIVPVPLHPTRLRQRGFNQSLLLGRALSSRTGVPVMELLRRDRYRVPQSRLPMKRRADNVRGAFSCMGDPAGKRVLLLDDVRTTGSTACACAQALLDAGAESVCLCVSAVVYRKARGK
ncbi:MAG: ComF family protein [Clostridia bacterium]|nr:ComF family protein [Clostridia bacterium]